MTSCCSTPPRSSAAARSIPPGARRSHRPARTTTAAAIRAGFGACDCTCSPPPTAPPRRDPGLRRPKRARRRPAPVRHRAARRRAIVCDKGYAGRDFEHPAAERFGARFLRPAPPQRARPGPTSPGSANASSRSSTRSKTASAWNATAPAPCTDSAHESRPNSSRWPPASGSTTSSTAPPALRRPRSLTDAESII